MIRAIGKAKIRVTVRGCMDCGVEQSSSWHDAETFTLAFNGGLPQTEVVHRCAECHGKKRKPSSTGTAPELDYLFRTASTGAAVNEGRRKI